MKKQRWRRTKKATLWNWDCADCGKTDLTSTLKPPKGWGFGGYGWVVCLCNSCAKEAE